MSKKALASLLALIVVIAVLSTMLYAKSDKKPEDPLKTLWAGNYEKERARWKEDLSSRGTQEAYASFIEDAAGRPYGIQHTFAHIFGELIYEKEGIVGIAFCDSTFAFGCYHSFSGRAIIDKGLFAVEELDLACKGKGLGCLHGIGHGILGYVGNDRLNDALEVCKDTSWKGPLGGCPGGVFMEYNFRTMESVTSAKRRELDPQNINAPCDSVPVDFAQECYYYQALWWTQVFYEDFKIVGGHCGRVDGRKEREACFRGLGEAAASRSFYSVPKTIAICDGLASPREALLCRQGAWRTFYADTRTRQDAPRICAGLSSDALSLCLSEFSISENIDRI